MKKGRHYRFFSRGGGGGGEWDGENGDSGNGERTKRKVDG
jgi:hypothetical protein